MKPGRRRVDVNLEELDRVLDGARQAPLSEADYDKLKERCMPWRRCWCGRAIRRRPAPCCRNRKIRRRRQRSRIESPTPRQRTRAQWRRGVQRRAEGRDRSTQNLKHGDRCPECGKGNVYGQKEPKVLVRIVGQAPLAATVYSLERLRCGACGQVFTAQEPEGVGPEKYDETAAAMIAQLKYGSGVPFLPVGTTGRATRGFRCRRRRSGRSSRKRAELIKPARDELIRQAAQGEVLHNDDTGMRVLKLEREPGDERTGVFTSGIVSTGRARKIALYFTGRQHAGENLADVLKQRASGAGAADPDVRRAVVEHCRSCRRGGDAAGQLSGPRKAAVCGSGGELSRGVPYVLEMLGEVYGT